MLLVTIDHIPGTELEVLGLVQGSMVQTKGTSVDVTGGFGSKAGDELKYFTEISAEARDVAVERMVDKAERLGADAIVGVRFATSSVMQGACEIIAYGTAVAYK